MKKILSLTLVTGLISLSALADVSMRKTSTKATTQQRMEAGRTRATTTKKTYMPADTTVKKTKSTTKTTEDMNDTEDY